MTVQGVLTDAEVRQAARKRKRGRAGGVGEVPPESWKAAADDGMPTTEWITRFCAWCGPKSQFRRLGTHRKFG
eukprot:3802935-Pyramimonas_sp.AAC.1